MSEARRRPGRVVDMVQARGQIVRGPLLVNNSLALFLQTTRIATELFPYHPDDPDADFQAAADELRAKLEPIDPPAWAKDGLWDTFYWDITMGDCADVRTARAGAGAAVG